VADVAGRLGVTSQIRLVAELRWRILRNHLRRKNSKLDLIGLIWAAILSGVMVIGLSFMICWGAYISISTRHFGWLLLLFWGVFLFWQAFPLFVAGFGATFEFRTLLRFPLSLTAFYLVGLAYGLADFAAIASICWLLAIAVGSAIASIGLTIPTVAVVSLALNRQIALGVSATDMTLLILTLYIAALTLGTGRTTVLQGAVHLVIFAAFMLISAVP